MRPLDWVAVATLLLMAIVALIASEHPAWLCKIGFHRWDNGYQCRDCGKSEFWWW